MPDLFSQISELLSDPQSAQKIQQIAASLSSGEERSPSSPSAEFPVAEDSVSLPPAEPPASFPLLSGFSGTSGRHQREMDLLNAVRPYLRASRAGKIDNAIKAIRVIDLLSAIQ